MITIINLCAPALIYVAFSLTQIIIDTFKGLYNTAFFKLIVMIIITILLNALCQAGMGLISWVIVFVPFIFMSVIVAILLYVFGLDPATGELKIKCDTCPKSYAVINPVKNPVRNHIDTSYSETPAETIDTEIATVGPFWSSDPQYA
jgi:hypothetical protein